jgi:hypothetical protein
MAEGTSHPDHSKKARREEGERQSDQDPQSACMVAVEKDESQDYPSWSEYVCGEKRKILGQFVVVCYKEYPRW